MSSIQKYQVLPNVPAELSFLEVLARNLWWSWKRDAKELFRRVDPRLWDASQHNPVVFLSRVPQSRFEELAADDSFLGHQEQVEADFHADMVSPVGTESRPFGPDQVIAYFSMEFGLHESIPIFAGGLGVLAGDHLKAASNLDLPLVGVGLLYRQGYFRQLLDRNGWQQEMYPETDLYTLPMNRAEDGEGNDLRISVTGPEGEMFADVWQIRVGRIGLYLLDTQVEENPPEIRKITAQLYVGEAKIRLAQEVLLGIGGMRALVALGMYPKVCHMNEGHSSFSGIERLALTMRTYHVDLKTALEIVPRSTVFTTHTPVAAAHDEFPAKMVKPYLQPFQKTLGATVDEMLSWGQAEGDGPDGDFSMFALGLHMAQYCNGVSRLHGEVARKMWSHLWPNRPDEETPISYVTNGIHISSFISREFANLFERYLGPEWYMGSVRQENMDRIDEIFDEELWRSHELNRSRLVRVCRSWMKRQYAQRNAPQSTIREAESVLDPDVLTIGFARRFTPYKRADLILQDMDRLKAIINSQKYPVQFIFAGKAHPQDNEGKELIRRLVEFARQSDVRRRFVFLENYDMSLARLLVQGSDVWLNTPRRPFEACGTSGMKAAVNGTLNVSILDGWWCEAYSKERGWAIGHGEEYTDTEYQDAVESEALYNVLENDIIPCFYDRKSGELPSVWVKMMKASIQMGMKEFCSLRMASEYERRFYLPAARNADDLTKDKAGEARQLADQRQRLLSLWEDIRIETPVREKRGPFHVGDTFKLHTVVTLGALVPEEVEVELYYGTLKGVDALKSSATQSMSVEEDLGSGRFRYGCTMTCQEAGRYGLTARVVPRGDARIQFTPKLVTWA
ncbi:MAG: alpha-glucan family phosphorylase [Deltaproteobacteria bacterium]|nr:alpha-glucan family phosphorylase [Deltaproteobacteria bacterium]